MNKMEKNVDIPRKPKFYKRFVDGIYRRRKVNAPDELFDKMNSYHPNIKLTIEIIPARIGIIYNSIRAGITCKKIPRYMRVSASRWLFIVRKAKIF